MFGEAFEDAPDDAEKVAVEIKVPGAGAVAAVCADGVRGTGAESLKLADVPVGRCDVQATVDGSLLSGTFQLRKEQRVQCRWEFADRLRCW